MKKISLLILLLIFASITSQAAKISSDLLKVAKPGSSNDKVLKLGDTREIRSNETTGELEFSNDGSTYKKIGSGAGAGGSGGINQLGNNSFEDLDPGAPVFQEWINSGGTLTQETHTNDREGNEKFARFVATGAAEYVESALVTLADDIGGGCMADFKYNQGDTAFEYKVLDNTSALIASGSVGDLSSLLKAPTITFPCQPGQQLKLRIESTGAGTIDLDEAYLGSNKNIAPLGKQSHFVGSIEWVPTANCTWVNSGGFANFPADVDCDDNPRVIVGNLIDSSSGQLPQFQLPSIKKGHYEIVVTARMSGDRTSDLDVGFAPGLNDGTTLYRSGTIYYRDSAAATSRANSSNVAIFSIDYSAASGAKTFDFQISTAGANTASMSAINDPVKIAVYFYPDSSDTTEAFTPESAGFYAEAIIGGANAVITNTGLDNVSNASFTKTNINGLSRALCSDGSTGTATSCPSGNMIAGIVVDIPRPGEYEFCANFITEPVTTNYTYFRNAEVDPGNPSTTLQGNGEQVVGSGNHAAARFPVNRCQIFSITSVGAKGFAMQKRVNLSSSNIYANSFEYKVSVRMVSHNVSRPILTGDTLRTPGANKPVLVSAQVQDDTSATIVTGDDDDFLNGNCSNGSTGAYSCPFTAGYWAAPPRCWIQVISLTISAQRTFRISALDTGQVAMSVADNSNVAADSDFLLFCKGIKN